MIRYEELEGSVGRWRERFAGAEPFPHVVIDGEERGLGHSAIHQLLRSSVS